MSFSSDEDPTILPEAGAGAAADDAPRLNPGRIIGAYRIERLLGRGGMGEVYEAEHLEHGRRVALKVLNQRLARAEDRERFLREGRLAASLNHPHTVYVYGSEEISGNPVIAMELVAGGTLKDVVDRDGPMPVAAAVDAILEVVAGLEAALACGVLHRDVKPSNCFVEPDGTVKVGDFGLSIPLDAPEVTQSGDLATFQGTPQFAAPEQLRGQRLDMRADVYAVGATLYYLLTGHPPFEDRDLMALLTRVAAEAPRPPARPGVVMPAGLSSLVLRCLAKDPAARPSSYAELDAALRPFSSAVPAPARPGLRVAAGVIDLALLAALTAPLAIAPILELSGTSTINASIRYASPRGVGSPVWLLWAACLLSIAYFAGLEGRWGRSLGKLVCGLRVTGATGQPVSVRQALARASLFALPNWMVIVPVSLAAAAGQTDRLTGAGFLGAALTFGGDAVLVLLFSSMRPRNGFAAWHDLATGTRVVTATRRKRRQPLGVTAGAHPAAPAPGEPESFGPYIVAGLVGPQGADMIRRGVDPALRRDVWIRVLAPGTPPVGALRARLGRRGRLRWLNGRRSQSEAWDAYEAPDGAPLLNVCATVQSWRVVQHWVADLARELDAASADASTPVLALDRVWVTRAGEARLLDFPAPGLQPPAAAASDPVDDPQAFVARVARCAMGDGSPDPQDLPSLGEPLPRGAQAVLEKLARRGFPSTSAAAAAAGALTEGLDQVTRPRRAASIVLANIPLLFALLALSIALPTAVRILQGEFLAMSKTLVAIRSLEGKTDERSMRVRGALELYAADRFRAAMADDRTWRDPRSARLLAPLKPTAERILSATRTVTDAERLLGRREAEAEIGNPVSIRTQAIAIAFMLPAAVLLVSALAAVVSALAVKGGVLLRLLGLAVATTTGADASRVRAAGRAVIAWSPVLLLWIIALAWSAAVKRDILDLFVNGWLPAAAGALALGGCAWAVLRPARGVAERLSGTWLVPR